MSVYRQFHAQAHAQGLITSASVAGGGFNERYFDDVLAARDQAEHDLETSGVTQIAGQRLSAQSLLANDRKTRLDAAGVETHETDRQVIRRAVMAAHWKGEFENLRRARMDALVPQASQALTSFATQTYKVRHKELTAWDRGYLDVYERVDRAAENHVWYSEDLQAVARAGSTYSPDSIPLVAGPSAGEDSVAIMPFLVGYDVNFMDDRRASLARANGKPDFRIQQMKLAGCYKVLAEAINALWLFGDTSFGIDGLLTFPLFQSVALPNGNWTGATGVQIYQDLVFLLTNISIATTGDLGSYSDIVIDLPRTAYVNAQSKSFTTAGDMTPMKAFIENFELRPEQIRMKDELIATNSQAFNNGPQNLALDTALVYYFDNNKTDEFESGDPMFILSQQPELPAAPIQTGVGFVQFLHARAGGIRTPDARRVFSATGF